MIPKVCSFESCVFKVMPNVYHVNFELDTRCSFESCVFKVMSKMCHVNFELNTQCSIESYVTVFKVMPKVRNINFELNTQCSFESCVFKVMPKVYHVKYELDTWIRKVRMVVKIRKRYNQVPHLTQDTTWESSKNTINTTKSQEDSTL